METNAREEQRSEKTRGIALDRERVHGVTDLIEIVNFPSGNAALRTSILVEDLIAKVSRAPYRLDRRAAARADVRVVLFEPSDGPAPKDAVDR
jgi:hypothetical protein